MACGEDEVHSSFCSSLQNILMNPLGNTPGARVNTVILATSTARAKTRHSVDVPAAIFWVLTKQATTAVTSAGILSGCLKRKRHSQINQQTKVKWKGGFIPCPFLRRRRVHLREGSGRFFGILGVEQGGDQPREG